MIDRKISAVSTLAYALWTVGLGLIAASFWFQPQVAALGLFAAGAGGVTQIRGFLCAMQRREHDAFELGRESVRPIR